MAFKEKRESDNIAIAEQMQRFTALTLTESNSIDLYHILNGPLLYPLCYHLFKESIEKILLKQQDALKTHDLMASTKIIDQSDVLIIKKDKEIDQSLRLVPYRLGLRLWYQFIRHQNKEIMRESSKIVLKNSQNLLVGIDFKLGNQSAITITEKSDVDEVAQDLLKEEAKTQFHGLEQKSLNLSDLKNWNKDLLKNQLRHENTEFDEINLTKDISTQTEAQVMSDEFEDTKETFEDSQETIENSQEIVGDDSKETYLVFLSQLCNTEALTKPDISLIGIAKVGEPCYVYLPTGEFHLNFYPASKDLRSFQNLNHKQEKEDLVLSMKEHKFLMNKIV